jgi:hypothetical protein
MKTDWKVAVDTKTRAAQDRPFGEGSGRPPSDKRNTSTNGDAVGVLLVQPGDGTEAQMNDVAAGNVDEAIGRVGFAG